MQKLQKHVYTDRYINMAPDRHKLIIIYTTCQRDAWYINITWTFYTNLITSNLLKNISTVVSVLHEPYYK
jgi:hypothetical protein